MLFRYLAEQQIDPTKNKVIKNGTKIIHLQACGVTLKDSFCYLAMPLSKMPAAFELEELAKGYFPHFFNTPENEDYVGTWPAKEYYALDRMVGSAREKFLHWHDEQKDKVAPYLFLM